MLRTRLDEFSFVSPDPLLLQLTERLVGVFVVAGFLVFDKPIPKPVQHIFVLGQYEVCSGI